MTSNFLIFGAGAIGSYLGGYLAAAGHQVTYLEREAAIPSLKERGIRLEDPDGEKKISHPRFIGNLGDLGRDAMDLGILAVKTYHLDYMLSELEEYKDLLPPLLCLQNGLENEEKIGSVLGMENVIAGTVTTAVDRKQKGDAVIRKERGLALAGQHPRVEEFVEIFQLAGVNTRYYKDPGSVKWSKLILNLLGNATSAILDQTPAEIFSNPTLYRIEVLAVRETLHVMKAHGIRTVNLPGVPVKLLTAIIQVLPLSISRLLLSKLIGGGRGEKMPSFHIDLHSGKGKSEVEQLNGAVARAGEDLNIPTPVNKLLAETLISLTNGEIALNTYAQNPGGFLELLD